MKSLLTFAIVTILVYGCKINMKPNYPEYQLKHNVVNIDSGFFGSPNKILISDSLIFIADEINNYYYSLLDIKNQKFIKRFGRKGSGPNEIITPSSIFFKDEKFGFNTVNTNLIAYFSLNEIINSHSEPKLNIKVNLNIKNKEKMYAFMTPLMMDNLYLATGFFSSGKYALIDIKNNSDSIFGSYPITEDIDQFDLGLIFQSVVLHHPNEKKVVNISVLIHDVIEVITYCKNKEFTISSKSSSFIPTIAKTGDRIHLSSANNFHYLNFSVTQNYIYLLYSGKSVAEDGYNATFGNTIHVYDWELNKICDYILDFDIQSIAVSPDDKTLYSFGIIANEIELLKWDLIGGLIGDLE